MMKRWYVAGAAAVLALASVGAQAQGPGGGGGQGRGMRGGGGMMLLSIPEVQQELKMTQPQIEKVQGLRDTLGPKMQEIMQGQGTQQEKMQAMQAAQTKAVGEILDTKQMKRYQQLSVQRSGVQAFTQKPVVDALKLTDDQQAKVKDVQQGLRDQMQGLFQGGFQNMSDDERQAAMKKIQEAQTAATAKIIATFSDSQKATWKDLTGEPFKFPPMRFGGRRPGN